MSLSIGKTKFCPGGVLRFRRYPSGETAIEIIGEFGLRELVATVALVPYGASHPGETGIWIKDWSENEGVADALVATGVVTLTGRTFATGHVFAKHGELTPQALAELNRGATH